MQGREASKATTIMQKFIKGSSVDGIPPMPVVIGMSATPQRFNALVGELLLRFTNVLLRRMKYAHLAF